MLSDVVKDVLVPAFGMGIHDYVLIVLLFAFFIFYAIDFRIGLLVQLVGLSLVYVGFNAVGWPTLHIIYVLMATLVLMALSLFVSYQKARGYA